MKGMNRQKNMCCILAIILLIFGMSGEVFTTDSSFLCLPKASHTSESTLQTAEIGTINVAVCTLNMLKNTPQSIFTISNGANSRLRGRICLSSLFVVIHLLHGVSYQSIEGKEDGQLFACRSRIIDYIHQKDSGE